ncbi:MAG TPA: hypothetical protein VFZ68_18295 [Acidimicrobiales bacterium]
MKRVRFDLDHMCGESYTVTAWTTATPGLVVWNDGPNNVPCADEDYGWCISQPNHTSNVFMGSTDHQIAMERAARLGGYEHDWTDPANGTDTFSAAVADLYRKGQL